MYMEVYDFFLYCTDTAIVAKVQKETRYEMLSNKTKKILVDHDA